MTNPVQMYGGGNRAEVDTTRDAPRQVAGMDDSIMQVEQQGQDPMVDQTGVDPPAFADHVREVFDKSHGDRFAVHNANSDALGGVPAHDFPTLTGQ